MRPIDGHWVEVDLLFEAGLAYMREHVAGGGSADVGEDHTHGKASRSARGWPRCAAGRAPAS